MAPLVGHNGAVEQDRPCSCCGEPQPPDGLAALTCHREIVVCRACVHWLAGTFGGVRSGSATPILPVRDMAESVAFWTAAGLSVERYDDGYAFVVRDGELLHLAADPGVDPALKASGCYIHARNVDELHAAWSAAGLPVSELADQPWGMREFSVKDPSGNLVRVGRNISTDNDGPTNPIVETNNGRSTPS